MFTGLGVELTDNDLLSTTRLRFRCMAIEDSPSGVLAARRAGMRCIAVPDPLLAGDRRFEQADLVASSLTQVNAAALVGVPSGSPDGMCR